MWSWSPRSWFPRERDGASLSAVRRSDGLILGFNARLSHHVVDVDRCPLLTKGLDALLIPLRELLLDLMAPGDKGQVRMTETLGGPDVQLVLGGTPDLRMRERLSGFAEAAGVVRLSWRTDDGAEPEPVVQRETARIDFSGIAVEFPSGAFLQPSREGESALVGLVTGGVGDAAKVLDLYAGLGTFSFALAKGGRVHAVESDPRAVELLQRAAGRSGLGGRVTAEVRDLGRRPLAGKELAGYGAAVFDPPRVGAAEQAAALAKSAIPRIVAVSCNPSTLARDARLLVDGGYRVVRAVPVDQFSYAAHVEAVMVFER